MLLVWVHFFRVSLFDMGVTLPDSPGYRISQSRITCRLILFIRVKLNDQLSKDSASHNIIHIINSNKGMPGKNGPSYFS